MKLTMWWVVVVVNAYRKVWGKNSLLHLSFIIYYFSLELRVRIKDNNSPHGKFHRFLFPFSSKLANLNFAWYIHYIYPRFVTCVYSNSGHQVGFSDFQPSSCWQPSLHGRTFAVFYWVNFWWRKQASSN